MNAPGETSHGLLIGQRVTNEPRSWYDGAPVTGWPRSTGVVIGEKTLRGMRYVRVRWDSGRVDLNNNESLTLVSP